MDDFTRLVIYLVGSVVVIWIIVVIRSTVASGRHARNAAELRRSQQGGSPSLPPAPDTSWPPVVPARPVTSTSTTSSSTRAARDVASRNASSIASGLDLSASAFAPISGADATAMAMGLGGAIWSNLWFGRRDRIPPADDPRTAIIDRAMVGQGLITPDELAEIHRVGAQMESLRGDLATVAHAGERAVLHDREARKQLKDQRKRESEERKRKHAEAVALRRKTDIIYLGRGVSKGLADRNSNVEKLKMLDLPELSTPADVATALGLPVPRLRWLAFHAEAVETTHYVRFTVPKKSGGTRELCTPHEGLAAAQNWVLLNVLEKLPAHDAAHGFVPGRSTLTNATPHVGAGVVVNADLTNFFPTITVHRVLGLFRSLGYSPAAATVLALLCTEAPRRRVTYAGKPLWVATGPRGLPQGACTSPAISNLVAKRFDARMSGIAAKLGFRYSRYADDLTFSAPADDGKVGYLLARVRHIAQDEGFAVNESKTRVRRPSARQTVTGVVVNDHPGVPRHLRRRMRAILHRAKSEGLAAQNWENHPHYKAWVQGMVSYVHMINPAQGAPLRASLDRLD